MVGKGEGELWLVPINPDGGSATLCSTSPPGTIHFSYTAIDKLSSVGFTSLVRMEI